MDVYLDLYDYIRVWFIKHQICYWKNSTFNIILEKLVTFVAFSFWWLKDCIENRNIKNKMESAKCTSFLLNQL